MRWDVQVFTPNLGLTLQILLLPLWVLSFSQPFPLLFNCSGAEIFLLVPAELVGAGQEQRLQGKPQYFGSSGEAGRVGGSLWIQHFLLGPQQSPGVNHSNMLMCN